MTNNKNFIGWSGKTEFTISDLIKSNFRSSDSRMVNTLSSIVESPVTINKSSKVSPSRTPSEGPVYKTGNTQTLSISSLNSVNLSLGVNTPFTAGTVDYSFPAGGGWQVDGFDGAIYHIIVDSNGKYLLGGNFGNYYYNGNTYYSPYLIRLNSDGTVDETFSTTYHWDCYGGSFNGVVYTLELQSDGKILVGGSFTNYDRDNRCDAANRIIRLNSDGSRDLTFNTGDGFTDSVYDIHVQPDGKILVGGGFRQYNNLEAYYIIRLNSNGSVDSSFPIGNGDVLFNDYVNVIELQSDGKILVGGYFTTYGNVSQNYITRLNTNGTLDTTFQIGNGFNDEVYTIALQSDGKIIAGGYFDVFDNNQLYGGKIIRLLTNGSIDTLFGYGFDGPVHSLAIQSDGKILVGGYLTDYYPNFYTTINVGKLVRFNSDCSYDDSYYNSYNKLFNDGVEYISILEDKNILVGGFFNNYDGPDPLVYPLNYFGRIHNSISVYPYTYTVESCSQPLMDETITYVVGSMTELNPDKTYSFQSLQNPSIIVCGFITETYPSNVIEYSMVNEYNNCYDAYTSNYKLVTLEDCIVPGINQSLPVWIVDNKYEINDILYVDIVFDGEGRTFNKFAAKITSVDPNWNVPFPLWEFLPPINYAPYSSCDDAIEANGLIYGAGSCSEMESSYPLIHKAIYGPTVLPLPTGNNPVKILYNYFPVGPYEYISGGTPEVYSFINLGDVYSDDYNDLCDLGLTKIAPEGLLNYNFQNTGFDGNLVYTMVEQPDGKILVGGNFSDYLEVSVGNFMRINPDGSLDETFYLGQFNSYIRAITIQPDGKILVGGNFTNYDGYNAGRIIRLNSDGTIDNGFTYSSEFNGTVRAIAVQRDGKIVVGGNFNYYYDFYCPQIVRLNSNGTPDPTFIMGDGFDGDSVYTISIESIRDQPFFIPSGPTTYTENIIVGGYFSWYNGTNVGGIVKLSSTGEVLPDFGGGFNVDNGGTPRVNQIVQQPDGKLIVIGGGNEGYSLYDYNNTLIPKNIVRLVKINDQYVIDETFTTIDWDSNGGFNGAVLSASVLPNGKIMVGGQFNNYKDNNDEHIGIPYLVRLNSNGTLDETFTFTLDDNYVNKTLLLSSGRLLVGGWFNTPKDLLLELFIGEEYKLHSFNTCDGLTSNIFLPTDFPVTISNNGTTFSTTPITYELISTDGLDLVYNGDNDDDNFVVVLPTPFDVNFLGVNYTSINVSTNPYITFGDGGNPSDCCFDIPNEIPTDVELPGVFLSFQCGAPESPGDYDADMLQLYTGLTDGGNTLIIKYFGKDHCNNSEVIPLNYTYRFYKDNSDYFDLLIDENTLFFNDDPTGGVSNGVDETWVTTFDSTGGNAYRIGFLTDSKPIKANINERVAVCGNVGNIITTPQLNAGSGIGGSMFFNGVDASVTIDNDIEMDLNFGPWTVEWYQKYTSTDTCCRRVFDIGQNPGEEFGVSIETGNTMILWLASGSTTINLNTPVYNVWSYFAISSENIGGSNQIIRVYQDGILIYSGTTNVDINNFQGDPQVNLPLIIGGGNSGQNSLFEGYITNFRWTNTTCYYQDATMNVPTIPLDPYNSQLLFLSTNETGLFTNTCEPYPHGIPANKISQNNVIWSSETPFFNFYNFSLFTATNNTSYNSCDECLSTTKLNTITYQRDGVNPNKVVYTKLTQDYINDILTYGPIWTYGPYRECYELLTYYK
jgi:uncharacterized delta-60 repeat protein